MGILLLIICVCSAPSIRISQFLHLSRQSLLHYAIVKNYDNAEKTLNKIIKFANEQGGEYYEAKASYVLAKVELARGDTEKAAKLIEKAKLIAKRTQDAALEKEIEKEIQGLF